VKAYYEGGGVTIYHGDCREFLPHLPQVDHTITDPPYDEQTHAGVRSATPVYGRISEIPVEFDPLDTFQIVPVLLTMAKRWTVAFCAMEMLGDYKRAAGYVDVKHPGAWVRGGFWRRPDGAPQFTGDRPAQPGDGIAIMHPRGRKRWNGGGHHAYWECPVERDDRVHPTQKPLTLMVAILSAFANPGEMILDPFAGVGTTAVAAKRLGMRAIAIELTEAHCEQAARRVEQTQPMARLEFEDVGKRKQVDMFAESGEAA
jgi:hypothetical protein